LHEQAKRIEPNDQGHRHHPHQPAPTAGGHRPVRLPVDLCARLLDVLQIAEMLRTSLVKAAKRQTEEDGEQAKALGGRIMVDVKRIMEETKMVFVFGSNEKGIHGGGAARVAREKYGAVLGQGVGMQGNSYAIPTCALPTGMDNHEIALEKVEFYVNQFIAYAVMHPEREFQVTQVGCGLAGWKAGEIAPLFTNAPDNCLFDSAWEPWLGDKFLN